MLEEEKVNILLVDDQPGKLLGYEAILSDLGENLIKATSGTAALEVLLKTDVAVVLIDVCMPDLDGFELAAMIRQHPRHAKTAIIFVSAVQMSDVDRVKGYEVGAVDYVSVPVVPEILRARVGVFAELYRKTRQLERLNHELERRVAERTAELEASSARLRENEERLRVTYEQAPVGICEGDLEGHLLRMNERFCAITGYSREELVGRHFTEITFPGDEDRDLELYAQLRAGDLPSYTLEKRYIRKDGQVVWIELHSSVVRDDGGCPMFAVGIVEDISNRKRIEAELWESREHLRQQARELEAANRELEAFSYTISHDLQAPLRAIEGFSGMMFEDCMDKLDADGKRYLTTIRRNVLQMHELLQSLLNFSRLGHEGLTIETVNMHGLARSVVGALRKAEPGSRMRVQVRRLAPAPGDAKLLRQVLANLVGNAWKFTREKPEPAIEIGSREEGGERVYWVKDNGIGFDMQYASKLFGIFERLHSEFEGTGVGLAIVRRIVERHGGRVWAEGRPGEGATFYFSLPASPAGALPGEPAVRSQRSAPVLGATRAVPAAPELEIHVSRRVEA